MWVVFGAKTKAKRVEGGREFDLDCPECEQVTHWVECDVKDEFNAFFVKVGASTMRRMVCTACGEDVSLDEMKAPPETPPQKRSTEWDKDALLAALKAKMKREGK
jgi:hypothetical protein